MPFRRISMHSGDPDGTPGAPDTPLTTPVLEPETVTRTETRAPWQVVVWDDPVNLMSYVVWVFQTVLGMPRAKAERKMLEVHHQGRSIVAETDREEGEVLVTRLQGHGLKATLETTGAS